MCHGKILWADPVSHKRTDISNNLTVVRLDINPSPPGQNGRNFADDIFKHISLNENDRIPIQILLKFVPRSPIGSGNCLVPNRQQAIT